MARRLTAPLPRFALTPPEAAASIGVGPDFFDQHIRPEVEIVRRGRKCLVPVAELERWVRDNAEPVLPTPSTTNPKGISQ